MTFDFSGRTVVVTGGSRGIGAGICKEMARCGANVVVNGVQAQEAAERVAFDVEDMGAQALVVMADVSQEDQVLQMRDAVLSRFGTVDYVINNAGIHQHIKSWDLGRPDWERILATNLTGTFLVSKAFIPHMKERGYGRIVNISSCAAYTGTDHEVHYAASKAGMIGVTKSLALELAQYGINVNAIAPGYIDTDMLLWDSEEVKMETISSFPIKRLGEPEDIARAVSFLCSKGGDYITGQMLHVNGGIVMP